MPEGPEIRRAADRVEKQLTGQPLDDAWFAFDELKPHAQSLIGHRVERVDTRGKAMLTRFDDGRVLYSHNQLYGVWKLHPAGAPPDTRRSLRVRLEAGDRAASLYSASDVSLWDEASLHEHPFLARLGPDLLSEDVSAGNVAARLEDSRFARRGLGGLLLDQSLVAGLGNYLRSEILFFARLHYKTRPQDLNDTELERLAHYIVALTWQTYRQAGVTNAPEWVKKAKARGEKRRQYRFAAFEREGLECHRCAAPIERVMAGSRRLYFCPCCQPPARPRRAA
ncbi:endonuclease VIII [Vreelandella jeotgali]|uniref:endonuclease VIII n=1 Tax=Vreelandella jeotgali TaxID=553386 RepID=UPI000345E43F|nr:endonuclease VIII [Halomonas jeotgali]